MNLSKLKRTFPRFRFAHLLLILLTVGIPQPSSGQEKTIARETPSTLAESAPNFVFFLIDDLGWADVGFIHQQFSNEKAYYESPNIDALASQSLVFTNAYANAPNCAPSRACLMSGWWPQRHGIYTVGTAERGKSVNRKLRPVVNQTLLQDSVVTMADVLQDHGYVTASIGKWHLGESPTSQGFDINVAGTHWGSPSGGGYFAPLDYPNLKVDTEGQCLTDCLSEAACQFIQDHKDERFFLYLSHYAVHTPLQGKPELVQKYRQKKKNDHHNNARYAAMIEAVDDSVGRVIKTLEQCQLTDKTVIVFFSDNGGHMGATSNAPLHGAKGMLYEGGIRVPMTIRWPGHTKTGHCDYPVQGIDLFPTFMKIAGITTEGLQLDGMPLNDLLDGKEAAQRNLYWHFPAYLEGKGDPANPPFRTTPASAIRQGDWKLIHWYEEDRVELYNLKEDLGEQHNLAQSEPQRTQQLLLELGSWINETDAFVPTQPNPEFRPAEEP